MAHKPKISDEQAALAIEIMERCMTGELDHNVRCRNATNLHSHWMQQERYALNPQTPADYERAARGSRHSLAAKHARLTPEEVLEMQAAMVGDAYPGKGTQA